MARVQWHEPGTRFHESGLDRGVLYLTDGSGVPWNGLTSVEEEAGGKSEPIYIDGIKYRDVQSIEDYSASLKAITYPDEFLEFDGVVSVGVGLFATDQRQKSFSLSYRTKIGNDTDGADHGHKIHLVYNLTAVPDNRNYESVGDRPNLVEFSWTIKAVPGHFPGYRPTAHIVIDTTQINSYLMSELEDILYGTETTDARLPTFAELVGLVSEWYLIDITDNGDGTWTATGPDEFFTMLDATTFEITGVDATYLDADTYEISSTY